MVAHSPISTHGCLRYFQPHGSNQGWRVSSRSLGRNLELRTRDGIVDFGVADMGDFNLGKRTGANFAAPPRSRIISGYYLP
jgi:hypothetical protein